MKTNVSLVFRVIALAGIAALAPHRAMAGGVWLPMTAPEPAGVGLFETRLQYSSWDAAIGAYKIIVRYNPAVLEIADITLPANSEFQGNVFFDTASFKSGTTQITAFQTANAQSQDTVATFVTIVWKSKQGTPNVSSDISVEATTVVDSQFRKVEVMAYGAAFTDTDGDGIPDNLDPDIDGDGLPNDWETANGLNPMLATGDDGAAGDPDKDGFNNLIEFQAGTLPKDPDSVPTYFTLMVSKNGEGEISSDLAGINCGSDCSEVYLSGTRVTLTATPGANYLFTGWGGVCSGTKTCTVTMDASKNVTADFIWFHRSIWKRVLEH